jgi:hypothetical protein
MPVWISDFLIRILTSLATWLVSKAMEKVNEKKEQIASDKEIDDRLNALKEAYKEAIDGKPITKEQRERLNGAVSDFIRGGSPRGGM